MLGSIEVDTLRLTDAECREAMSLAERREAAAAERAGESTEGRRRFGGLHDVPVQWDRPAEKGMYHRTIASSISPTRVGLISGVYIHPRTKCEMAIPTVNGDRLRFRGVVVDCVHLAGRAHSVIVELAEQVDVAMFVRTSQAAARRRRPGPMSAPVAAA